MTRPPLGTSWFMGDYTSTTTVRIAPDKLFDYLSDVTNLPTYLPQMTSARPAGGDRVDVTAHIEPPGQPERDVEGEAWVKVKEAGRTLEWGAPGPHDYHGELDVDAADDGASTLTLRLHTEHVDGPDLQHAVDETVQGLRSNLEAKA